MKTIIKITILFSLLIISACEINDEPNIDILGNWVKLEYLDDEIKFEKTDRLLEDHYGVSFLSENVFIERQTGWCGTPPVYFDDYQGVWRKKDQIIEIDIDIDGMEFNKKWKIKSLNENYLIVEILEYM